MQQTHTSRLGFTLVETLVAITVLLIAISGPFYAIQKAITSAVVARDQLIANALAQEGLEYIYALRDNNYLQDQQGAVYTWLAGIDGTTNGTNSANCYTPSGCTVDPGQDSIVPCAGTCAPLNINGANIYTQVAGSPASAFTRTVTATAVSAFQTTIQVKVTWSTAVGSYQTIVTEDLYNWL